MTSNCVSWAEPRSDSFFDPIYFFFWRRQWHPTPVLLPGKSHGWRSLVGSVHGVPKSRTQLSDFPFTFHFYALEKEMATHSSVLAWRIPGQGSLVGCRLWGRRVGHDWSDLAAAARGLKFISPTIRGCCVSVSWLMFQGSLAVLWIIDSKGSRGCGGIWKLSG